MLETLPKIKDNNYVKGVFCMTNRQTNRQTDRQTISCVYFNSVQGYRVWYPRG